MQDGLLGTAASRTADLVLALEMAMGLGLLLGALLARKRRFRLHAWCQSAVVLANLVVIVLTMAPSFGRQIVPVLAARPERVVKSRYALVVTHAALGSVTVILLGLATYGAWYLPHFR